ncbi:MAG: hypothetical protein PHU21_02115 [Elusimicrobia bacterium]|nr:hypothetical protein [Elusimicrobiota bacterium]
MRENQRVPRQDILKDGDAFPDRIQGKRVPGFLLRGEQRDGEFKERGQEPDPGSVIEAVFEQRDKDLGQYADGALALSAGRIEPEVIVIERPEQSDDFLPVRVGMIELIEKSLRSAMHPQIAGRKAEEPSLFIRDNDGLVARLRQVGLQRLRIEFRAGHLLPTSRAERPRSRPQTFLRGGSPHEWMRDLEHAEYADSLPRFHPDGIPRMMSHQRHRQG